MFGAPVGAGATTNQVAVLTVDGVDDLDAAARATRFGIPADSPPPLGIDEPAQRLELAAGAHRSPHCSKVASPPAAWTGEAVIQRLAERPTTAALTELR
jgi:hypothetical protein